MGGEVVGGFGITSFLSEASDVGPGKLNVTDGNECHQGPIADEQTGADSDEGARFEKAEEQAGEEIGKSDAIEDAEQTHIGPGLGESAGIKDADDVEQNAAANDAFDGVGLAGALDSFAEGKDN